MKLRCCLLVVLFSCGFLGSSSGGDLSDLEDRFAKAQADELVAHGARVGKLRAHYSKRLDRLAAEFKKSANEVGVAAVASAQEALEVGVATAKPIGDEVPAALLDAQRIFGLAMAKLDEDYRRSALLVKYQFVRRLELLKAKHAARGEGAVAGAITKKLLVHALTEDELALVEGGCIQFFGETVRAKRAVFMVDFSGSMSEGDRVTEVKQELDRTLVKLPDGTFFNVIYYSHRPWLGGESVGSAPFRDPADQRDRIPWLKVGKKNIAKSREHLGQMQLGGATNWIPPLQLALAMNPPPDAIWLLSDGDAADRKELVAEIGKINPGKVPIHTVGMEIGGPVFASLVEIAEATGGNFSIVMDGKLHEGEGARRFAGDEFAPEE